jgi:hypothetical protein
MVFPLSARVQPGIAMYGCIGALPSAFAICGLPPARSLDGLALVADLRGFFILRRSQDLLYVTGHEIQLRRNAGHYQPHAALIQQGG